VDLTRWLVAPIVAEVLSTLEVADCCYLMLFPALLIRFDVVRSVAAEDSVAWLVCGGFGLEVERLGLSFGSLFVDRALYSEFQRKREFRLAHSTSSSISVC
jgi:hypothetical protein